MSPYTVLEYDKPVLLGDQKPSIVGTHASVDRIFTSACIDRIIENAINNINIRFIDIK